MAITALQDSWGRYVASAEVDYGEAAAGQMRVCVFDALTSPMWVKRVRVWMGKSTGTNATLRCVVYDMDAPSSSSARMGYTASSTVSTSQTGSSGGAAYEADMDAIDTGPSTSALLVPAGTPPGVGFLVTGGPVNFSMRQASAITADNEQFYDRSGLSQPPPATIGAYSVATQGHISIALVGEFNVAPLAPNNRTPYGAISSLSPTFEGDFRDLNGTYGDSSGDGVDRGDKMARFQITVRRVSDGVVFWNVYYDATSTERTNDQFSRAYAGTALVAGTAYEWQCQCKDDAGEWGDESSWLEFTPQTLGTITLDGDPTGKVEEPTGTPLDFDGKWTHASSKTMLSAMVRLYDQGTVGPNGSGQVSGNGTLIDTSPEYTFGAPVSSSAAPGTAFAVPFADCGFTLSRGKRYGYSIRGKDSDGNWGEYSAVRSFAINDPPSTPTQPTPTSGTFTSYPFVQTTCSDDDDTTASGLVVSLEITRPDLSTTTVSMTYNATSGKWEFQLTGTEVTATGVYTMRCRSYDGTVYSGGESLVGDAAYSSTSTFTYATGPAITFVAPVDGDVIDTATPTLVYTLSTTQAQRRVIVTDVDADTTLIDSGWVTTSQTSYDFPVGGLSNDLANVDITVQVVDVSALSGESTIRVSVSYTPPDDLTNVDGATVKVGNDLWDTTVRLRWDASELGDDFGGVLIRRRYTSEPAGDAVIVARITNASVTEWLDYHAPAGDELTYLVSQYESLAGGETLESVGVEVPITLTLNGLVLVSTADPVNTRATLWWVEDFEKTRRRRQRTYEPLSGAEPITVAGSGRYWEYSLSATIVNEWSAGGVDADTRHDDLERFSDQSGTLSIRDDAGTRAFVKIDAWALKRRRPAGWKLTAAFRQNRYTEEVGA